MRVTTAFKRLLDLPAVNIAEVDFQVAKVVVTLKLARRRLAARARQRRRDGRLGRGLPLGGGGRARAPRGRHPPPAPPRRAAARPRRGWPVAPHHLWAGVTSRLPAIGPSAAASSGPSRNGRPVPAYRARQKTG